ncbi:MAG: hypothetical protein PHT02_14665 [Tissierellia bacterium]|nr:hypothetical protein [Tissierellia bacterium]
MKCTQEQYESDLKQPLLEMGYEEQDVANWDKYPILTNNLNDEIGIISNIEHYRKYNSSRYFINHYNPELFLALAAMTKIKDATGGEIGGKGEWIVSSNNKFEKLHKKMFIYYNWRKATKEELINKFTNKMEEKQDLRESLQSGDIVEFNNGNIGIVIDTRMGKLIQFKNSYTEATNFDENLKAVRPIYDIIKIRRISQGMQILPTFWKDAPVIWERKEPKEITLDELIKEAGYEKGEVKIKVE